MWYLIVSSLFVVSFSSCSGIDLKKRKLSNLDSHSLKLSEFYRHSNNKFIRNWMFSGTKWMGPSTFFLLENDPIVIANKGWNPYRNNKEHKFEVYQNPHYIKWPKKKFQEWVKEYFSGQYEKEWVFKPLDNAFGKYIFFLKREETEIILTTSLFEDQGRVINKNWINVEFLKKKFQNIFTINDILNEGIRKVIIPRTEQGQKILNKLWQMASVEFMTSNTSYDPGILETRINYFKHDGKSYETRHSISEDYLYNKKYKEMKKKFMGPHWFSRIGHSKYFSNLSDRHGQGKKLYGKDEMYEPLFKKFNIQNKEEFFNYLRNEFINMVDHIENKLKSINIEWDMERSQYLHVIDLVWQNPKENEIYHRPIVMEWSIQ